MRADQLKTPAALVDLDVVERNTTRMGEKMTRLGVALRPHVKTHKCIEAARLQVREHSGGITVSTLAEARFFADAGFHDITWAFPVPVDRLDDIAALSRRVDRLNLLLDHPAALRAVRDFATTHGLTFPIFLKVDCGDHRAGVDPKGEDGIELARAMYEAPEIDFRGILTHAGQSYQAPNAAAMLEVARLERDVMTTFAARLRDTGVPVPEVSVGSTPTMTQVDDLTGVTEARPGNYVFFDMHQATTGSCELDDIAFSVLATVVGVYPHRNQLIVNAGALALSKDQGPRHVDPNCGYGLLCDATSGTPIPQLELFALSQEHGQIRARQQFDLTRFEIGSLLRILPNHSCTAASLFDTYHVIRGDEVIDQWRPVRGW